MLSSPDRGRSTTIRYPRQLDHRGTPMPRIIVTTDPVSSKPTDESPVLLEEHVHSVHLSSGHAAAQLVERLAWAVSDAEHAEDTHLTRAAS
jgi:hypothetical protein